MGRNHEEKGRSRATRGENPLKHKGEHQDDVKSEGLHGVEPDIAAEGRVSNDAQVKSEEGDKAGVRDGPIEEDEREDGIKEKAQIRKLNEEEAAIV